MGPTAPQGPWTYLLPLALIALAIIRNARTRTLRVERLWISPVLLLALTGLMLSQQTPPGPAVIALYVLALALGALAGWWRGRLTRITVDPETHALTSKASPAGMLLILGLFALRYGLRSFGGVTAGLLHVSVLQVTDTLMLLAVGLVCVQRLEMAIRAMRLVDEARANKP